MTEILPKQGYIRVVDFASWLNADLESLLRTIKVPIIKINSRRSTWLIDLEKLL